MASQIVVYGEALMDMYFESADTPLAGARLFRYQAVPGGAPANVAVHLANLGLPVSLMAGFADDPPGEYLQQVLREWGVDLHHSIVHERAATPLAMVNLTSKGERSFRLYLRGTAAEKLTPEMIAPGTCDGAAWFHFGSVLLSFTTTRAVTETLLERCTAAGAVISCDVNVRPGVWADGSVAPTVMLDILRKVDVLKVSDEDLKLLTSLAEPGLRSPYDLFRYGPRIIAYTPGAAGADIMTRNADVFIPAPRVDVTDTTGAGDAFTAGLIFGLWSQGIRRRAHLEEPIREDVLRTAGRWAARNAASVLTHKGALPSPSLEA